MRRSFAVCLSLPVAVFVATGCTTAVSPFVHIKPDYTELPEGALRELAGEIEQAVREGEREPKIADRDGLVVSDDLVMQAIRTRALRSELIGQFLDDGYGRELRNGLIEVAGGKEYKRATTGRKRNRNALLIMSENNDRWTIYEGMVKASHLPRRSLSAIQETFYAVRVEAMSPGQRYEDASGQTAVKGR